MKALQMISAILAAAVLTVVAQEPLPDADPSGPHELADTHQGYGYVVDWLICGPFPNEKAEPVYTGWSTDYLEDLGGETEVRPVAGQGVKKGRYVKKWEAYRSPDVKVDLLLAFYDDFLLGRSTKEYIVGYAACYVKSDKTREVMVKVGSDDGYKLWVNHELVSAQYVRRGWRPDEESYRVKLKQGHNLVMVKVDQNLGGYDLSMRLTDVLGKRVDGVEVWLEGEGR